MKKLIIIFVAILLVACAAPSPQVTVTSEVTVTLIPTKAPKETPTPTTTPLPPEMTEGDKQIWDVMPKTMEMGDGSEASAYFDPTWGYLYKDADGNVVGAWNYNKYNYDKGNITIAKMVDGKLVFVDKDGNETVKYPEKFSVTIEGNKFSGVELYTTARNWRLNPTLSRETTGPEGDLGQMMQILVEAYNEGLIQQFAADAMTPDKFIHGHKFLPDEFSSLFEISADDFFSKKWSGNNRLPYIPLVFPADHDQIRWTPVMTDQVDGVVSGWWGIDPMERDGVIYRELLNVQDLLDNGKLSVGRGTPEPFQWTSNEEELWKTKLIKVSEVNNELNADKSKQERAFEEMISTGSVPEELSDGTIVAWVRLWGAVH